MSRGGRRRRSRRSTSTNEAAAPAAAELSAEGQEQNQAAGSRVRRDGGKRTHAREAKPSAPRLKTLPADGVVLEDLIAGMQAEYGIPATPQEYRLLIRVPTSSDEVAGAAQEPEDEEPPSREEPSIRTARSRRRRRSRRRAGESAAETIEDGSDHSSVS
jgi:ribonuclease E